MANEFTIAPELDESFPCFPEFWDDPVTGLVVPKTRLANLEYRAAILEQAEDDPGLQKDLYTACSKSILYFINVFCFTKKVFDNDPEDMERDPDEINIPWITWPIQDEHILRLEGCIDGRKSLLTDKSRDMGATWNHIGLYTHRFLFRDDEEHLMLSRKEEVIDILDGVPRKYPFGPIGAVGTLFGKIDYILSRLPQWMLPSMSRKKLHLVNHDNKSRIDGESANATAGSSDRRTSIFMDEMAKMAEGEAIKRSTKAVTKTRFPCSTPNGAGTAYSKWRLSGQIPVFIMPWWEHPDKGDGRYVELNELGRYKIRSPWYDQECEESTPREVAIEIDMDHVGSGNTIFEHVIIEQHRKMFARPCYKKLSINFKKKIPDCDVMKLTQRRTREAIRITGNGKWRIWCELHNGRPDPTKTYTFGIDIGKGQGASNSVISVICDQTKEKVAEFACAVVKPYMLARIVCAAAIWFGGKRLPYVVWENNGDPGHDFGNQLVTVYKYSNIYFAKQTGTIDKKKGKRYGWRSDPEQKASVLGNLARAYAHGGFINHSEESLNEALEYVRYEKGGGVGPASLVEESSSARLTHGDRVIADMLCLLGSDERCRPDRPYEGPEAPMGSIGARLKEYKRRRKAAKSGRRFNFGSSTKGVNYARY